jgi:hypothetical protein
MIAAAAAAAEVTGANPANKANGGKRSKRHKAGLNVNCEDGSPSSPAGLAQKLLQLNIFTRYDAEGRRHGNWVPDQPLMNMFQALCEDGVERFTFKQQKYAVSLTALGPIA